MAWVVGIRGLMSSLANLPQGNLEPLVVKTEMEYLQLRVLSTFCEEFCYVLSGLKCDDCLVNTDYKNKRKKNKWLHVPYMYLSHTDRW